ncbi:hypothetical protein Agub_g2500, partial [Astrephomene gubernaculifera]
MAAGTCSGAGCVGMLDIVADSINQAKLGPSTVQRHASKANSCGGGAGSGSVRAGGLYANSPLYGSGFSSAAGSGRYRRGVASGSAHGGGGGTGGGAGSSHVGGGGGSGRHIVPPRSRPGKWDEVKLWQLGYRQELPRRFTMLNNMAICTSVLSFFAIVDMYGTQGLAYGGPVSVVWGWAISAVFSIAVALSLAELLSAYPTSGGIYYWCWVMAPVRHRTLVCWMAG